MGGERRGLHAKGWATNGRGRTLQISRKRQKAIPTWPVSQLKSDCRMPHAASDPVKANESRRGPGIYTGEWVG
jgi:hypothetical protein